jgi:hypothetical protein
VNKNIRNLPDMPKSYGSLSKSSETPSESNPKPKSKKEQTVQNIDVKLANLYDVLIQPSHTQQSLCKICGDIQSLLNSGTTITQIVVDQLVIAVCSLKQGGYYYGSYQFTLPSVIYNTLTSLFSQNDVSVSDDMITHICSANIHEVLNAILKSGIKLGSPYQTKQIISRVSPNDFDKEGEIKNGWACLLVNYPDAFIYNSEILLLACNKKLKNFISICINKKIGDISLVKLATLSGAKYDETALEYACKTRNIELVKTMLNNKVKPTDKCFSAILDSRCNSSHNSKTINNVKSDLIAILISFGYKVTYNDIIKATEAFVELNNFKSLGIKLDQKFIEVCAKVGFYPYENCGIKPNLRCLQLECNKSGNLAMIKN